MSHSSQGSSHHPFPGGFNPLTPFRDTVLLSRFQEHIEDVPVHQPSSPRSSEFSLKQREQQKEGGCKVLFSTLCFGALCREGPHYNSDRRHRMGRGSLQGRREVDPGFAFPAYEIMGEEMLY